MGKRFAIAAVVACALGAQFGVSSALAVEGEPSGQCTRYHQFESIGNRSVPSGATCELYNVTAGSLMVRPGGTLIISSGEGGGSVIGAISVNSGTLSLVDSTAKAISLNEVVGAGVAAKICNSTVSSVAVTRTPAGGSVVVGGSGCDEGCESEFCEEAAYSGENGNTILGNVNVTFNAAHVAVDDNDIKGSFNATSNTGGVEAIGNSIGGNVNCTKNSESPAFFGNEVGGTVGGQCKPASQLP